MKTIMKSLYDSTIADGWEDGIYLVEKDGKKGAFDSRNIEELIPCICDEMLERIDECGVIPFRRGWAGSLARRRPFPSPGWMFTCVCLVFLAN